MSKKFRHPILHIILVIASGLLWILSFKPIREAIWRKVSKKAKEKIIDVEAKIEKK